MFDIKREVATSAIDEVAKTLVPALDPILQAAVDRLLAGLKELLIGREITIIIK